MQLAGSFYKRHAVTPKRGLRLLVGARFQVLFHSPLGVLFTFPSRYSSTIGHRRVLSLGGWSPLIPTGFHVSGGTWDARLRAATGFAYGAVTLYRPASQPVPLPARFVTRPGVASPPDVPLPRHLMQQRLAAVTHAWV